MTGLRGPYPGSGATLVIGGVRSGKTKFAQELASAAGSGTVHFIATAQAVPDDRLLAERIARHRASRPAHWQTTEAPVELPVALKAISATPRHGAILVDCLTLWLANILVKAGDPAHDRFPEAARGLVAPYTESLIAALGGCRMPVILVTNEVGSGVAPATTLGNVFADLQGELNVAVAARCAAVYHLVAGIPTRIK